MKTESEHTDCPTLTSSIHPQLYQELHSSPPWNKSMIERRREDVAYQRGSEHEWWKEKGRCGDEYLQNTIHNSSLSFFLNIHTYTHLHTCGDKPSCGLQKPTSQLHCIWFNFQTILQVVLSISWPWRNVTLLGNRWEFLTEKATDFFKKNKNCFNIFAPTHVRMEK